MAHCILGIDGPFFITELLRWQDGEECKTLQMLRKVLLQRRTLDINIGRFKRRFGCLLWESIVLVFV